MRTVNFFIIVFGTSLTYVHCKPAHSYSTRLLPNDIIRVKKRHEDSSAGYLEQCGIVTFPKAQQGVVNVLAFLDSSWPYSHRQAIMLKMLNERLQKSGLPDTLFFVVNVDPSSARTVDNAEDDIEREAWLGVSPEEIETFSDIVRTSDSLAMSMTSEIQLIQDNEDLEIWKDLRGSRDQVLVIDRCGKLTYQVIVPWSILHFPYVKAAILSTYKDEPCGPCDVIHNTRDPLNYRDEATTQRGTPDSDIGFNSSAGENLQNDRDVHVPVVPESDLRSVLEFSTTNTSQSGSTPAYLGPEAIDVTEEATTKLNIVDSPDNYTLMNSDAGIRNEYTTLTSAAYTTTENITKIESEATTISSIFSDSEATDYITTVTSHPINNDKITDSQFNEKSTILQNISDDPRGIEEKVVTSSTDFINSDTTESKYSVSYYETTENIEDTTVQETLESNASKFFKTPEKTMSIDDDNSTESSVEKEYTTISINKNANQLDDLSKNIYIKDDVEDTTAQVTSESNTSRLFKIQEKSSNIPLHSVEKENLTISINNNANQLDSLAENIYTEVEFENTTEQYAAESNASRFFKIQEKSTNFYNENNTQSSVEKDDTTISINSDSIQLDSVALTNNPDESVTSENVIFNATTEESNENKNSEDPKDVPDENKESQDISRLSDVPLRIIMHAPHFHVDGDSTRMHEYLVLKTGSSDYHRHLASYDATRLYRGPQDFQESPEYLRNDEIESKKWPMTNVIYNRDESPGLYGEVADYWKNSGGQENYDYTEETETSEIEQNTEEPNPDERISMKPSKTSSAHPAGGEGIVEGDSALIDDGPDKIPDRLQADFADESATDKQIWSEETLNAEEEVKRSKLIAHYSKLLPWIYYVLDK